MIVHRLHGLPAPALAQAVAEFETQFSYPLGPGRSFRISHGDDAARFFRAMGEASSFVAERDGRVLGVLGAAIRRIDLPDASRRPVVYLGDLKVAPTTERGRVLLKLSRAAETWARPKVEAAFCVVMNGTVATPLAYAGRLGIPALEPLGEVVVLRLRADPSPLDAGAFRATHDIAMKCWRRWSRGRWALADGDPAMRSETPATWLMLSDGSACGLLEDTRKAKRLFTDDGAEMLSAHLSCLAYRSTDAGAELLRVAARRAGQLGFPALFVAVAGPEAAEIIARLAEPPLAVAPATIYGTGLPPLPLWNINSAEI